MEISRLWKLDMNENVYDIEKLYDCEIRENFPLQIDGRILEDNELLENINVSAETDILLYEV